MPVDRRRAGPVRAGHHLRAAAGARPAPLRRGHRRLAGLLHRPAEGWHRRPGVRLRRERHRRRRRRRPRLPPGTPRRDRRGLRAGPRPGGPPDRGARPPVVRPGRVGPLAGDRQPRRHPARCPDHRPGRPTRREPQREAAAARRRADRRPHRVGPDDRGHLRGPGGVHPLRGRAAADRRAEPPAGRAAPARRGELEFRIRAELAEAGAPALHRMVARAHRHGSGYTLGEQGHPPTEEYRPLADAGVRTLVAVPVGPPDGGGVLLVADERLLRPDPTTVNLMELLAGQAWTCLDRLRTLARLREQASSDPLTGLGHTGPFGQRIARATPGRTALLAIDVDGFKAVNDTYGHQAGDRLLVGLARALEAALRQGDELYRIGGDEFVAVIEVNRPEEAIRIGERLAEAARVTGRTISVGVALPRPGESPEQTLRRADQALYVVKRQGRDGVRLAAA
ncbi:diguanylate cyclase with GAF sensor [Micromonospora sp. ATCC 39149]|nr:diguanylate cyclase with GAF sensor [Micromonospora sp. ATCC 39149]